MCCASHLVSLRAAAEGRHEQILTDGNGEVRRIQCYYIVLRTSQLLKRRLPFRCDDTVVS